MGHEKDMRRMERLNRFELGLCPHDAIDCVKNERYPCYLDEVLGLETVVHWARERREVDDD